VDPEFVSR
jgi:polyadenylate-binding protein